MGIISAAAALALFNTGAEKIIESESRSICAIINENGTCVTSISKIIFYFRPCNYKALI